MVARKDSGPDFDWVIQARTDIQWDLLALFRMVDQNGPLAPGDSNALKTAFSSLVGASFSLWRAAFLSNIDQEWSDILGDARDLLDKLLTTNAVSFQTDLECRDWVFGYYLTSALDRLARAKTTLGVTVPDSEDFDRIHSQGLFYVDRTPHQLWDLFRRTLVSLTNELKSRIDAKSTTGPPAV